MIKKYIGIIANLLLLAGCSGDETFADQLVNGEIKTFSSFTATLPDLAETRAYLGDADETGINKRVFWEGWESIYVYSDEEPELQTYRITNISDNNVATFTGNKISGKKFYAFFANYTPTSVNDDGKVYFSTIFTWMLQNEYDSKYGFSGILAASSDSNEFNFKQTLGLLHFTFTDVFDLTDICFYGNNHEPIGCSGYVDLSEEQPIYKLDGESNWWEIGMNMRNINLNNNSIDFYILIQPITLENGFSLRLRGYDENGKEINFEKTTSQKIKVDAATVAHFPTVNVKEELIKQQELAIEIEAEQKQILMQVFDSLNSSLGSYPQSWVLDNSLSSWEGVNGVKNGFITDLNLNLFYNLIVSYDGVIPECIKDLEKLEKFHIWNAKLAGKSLSNLFALKRLTMFSFQHCDIEEELPNSLYDLKELTSIFFIGCHITGSLKEDISNLSKLEFFQLDGTQLTGTIPSTISHLSRLSFLCILNHKFEGNISFIEDMLSLNTLYIDLNNLTGTEGIWKLKNLNNLIVSNVSNMPSSIANLSNLSLLSINGTYSSIPDDLYTLSNLVNLSLEGNYTSIPEIETDITNVNYLTLRGKFTELPSIIKNMKNLKSLYLQNNNLSSIPSWIENLSNLSALDLSNNHNITSIPSELAKLTNLVSLNLNNNQIEALPDLSGLTKIQSLYLSSNILSGSLPEWISTLKNLNYLEIGYNQFTGDIPTCYYNLKNLKYLHLGGNHLSITMTDELQKWLDSITNYYIGNQIP